MDNIMARKTIMSVSVEADLAKRLTRLAKAQRISRSQLVARILSDDAAQTEVMVKAFQNPAISNAFSRAFADPAILRAFADVMDAELGDEQLELFSKAMKSVAAGAGEKKGKR